MHANDCGLPGSSFSPPKCVNFDVRNGVATSSAYQGPFRSEEPLVNRGDGISKPSSESDVLQVFKELLNEIQGSHLPRLEIDPFTGNPEHFYTFLSSFRHEVEAKVSDPHKKLSYLLHYCHGPAKEAIRHCVLLPSDACFMTAMEILKSQFGRPSQVIQAVTEGMYTGQSIRHDDIEGLQNLVTQMRSGSITLSQLGRASDLNCTVNLLRIVGRLPKALQNKWAEVAESFMAVNREPSFDDLINLVSKRIAVMTTEYGRLTLGQNKRVDSKLPSTSRIAAIRSSDSARSLCPKCGKLHSLDQCTLFAGLGVPERWEFLKSNKRCFRCLAANHMIRDCKSVKRCGVDQCPKIHHPLLHSQNLSEEVGCKRFVCGSHSMADVEVRLGFVPVQVRGNHKTIRTYAFLDNGSDCTLVTRKVARILGLTETPTSIQLATLHGVQTVACGRARASLESLDGSFASPVSVVIVDRLPVDKVDTSLDRQKWPHLSDVDVVHLPSTEVGILIGCDVPEVHWVEDQRIGTKGAPFAIKSPLGWVVRGPLTGAAPRHCRVNAVLSTDKGTDNLVKRMNESEFSDIDESEEKHASVSDELALKQVESTIAVVDGRYQLAVPWKQPELMQPGNKSLVRQRLKHLRRKLSRDEDLRIRYNDLMNDYVRKACISRSELGMQWFLPHHPIINLNKPGKVRIVFDCSASEDGVSLNDALLQGLDLINNLTGVLMRFRRSGVALSADISEMFLQVRLAPENRWAFSFLWWTGGDLSRESDI